MTLHIRYDNIAKQCRKPKNDRIVQVLTGACNKARNALLIWSDRSCFCQPIGVLHANGQRLIVVIEVEKYNGWTAEADSTLMPNLIVARFEGMNTKR